MKALCFAALMLLLFMGIQGCEDKLKNPGYSIIPHIELESAAFVRSSVNHGRDSLKVSIKFQDGDGDLGLSEHETDPKFQLYTLLKGSNGNYIYYDSNKDTLDCNLFTDVYVYNRDTINDTVRIVYNKYFYNFHIQVFVKTNGSFEEYDFRKEACVAPLGGRFPLLLPDRKNIVIDEGGPFYIIQYTPWEGIIEFTLPTNGFYDLFKGKTIKLKIYIIDRALHESNVVESEPFVIQ